MSRRFLDRTNAPLTPSGAPAWEIALGWDPPTSSYWVAIEDMTRKHPQAAEDGLLFRAGFMGELPTFDDLAAVLTRFADRGWIDWPIDPVLEDVLRQDQAGDVSTTAQDWDEVDKRKTAAGW